MVLAEMSHAHNADSQPLHADLRCSLARPCLPRCWASMKSSRLLTSGQRWP